MALLSKMFVMGLAATLIAQAADGASILANGSFESPSTNGGPFGATADNWTLTNAELANVTVFNGPFGGSTTAADGVQYVILNENSTTGSASQIFATTPNTTYVVSFAQNQLYDGTGANAPQPTSVDLTALVQNGANTLFTQDYVYHRGSVNNTFATDPTWTEHTFSFLATGSSTTLSFINNTVSDFNFGQAVDNVTVTALPEPGSIILAGTGLLGLLAAVRAGRKHRRPISA